METNKDGITIPYVAHEQAMDRVERREKRLVALIWALVLIVLGTNIGWIVYESQFMVTETVTTTEFIADTGDGDGNAIVTNDGGVCNGES